MKRSIFAAVLCGVLSLGVSSWALTINGTTNVGDRDDLVASTALGNSGDATELAWVQSILGTDFTMDAKYDTVTADWIVTNEANTYAMALDTTPEYFLIKTGNVGVNDSFLFKNLDELAWAVVNLKEDFGEGYTIKNVGKFSHVDEFSGGSTPVPEPSTMVLLGAGLLGVAICGKRRMNKA